MSIRPPQLNRFQSTISSHIIASSQGQVITPAQNAYPAYVSIIPGASVTDDVYELWINFTSIGASGATRDAIAKIGLDPLGGTTFADFIVDLTCGSAGNVSGSGVGMGGIWFRFPVRIRAGTSIGFTLSVNTPILGTGNALVVLRGKPTREDLIRAGSFVRTFGAVTATSSGTTVIPGANPAKGAWVSLGTLAEPLWGWVLGVGMNNAAQNNNPLAFDLAIGDATTKIIIVQDMVVIPNTAEVQQYTSISEYYEAPAGLTLFARAMGTGVTTGWSAAAYGIGG